MSWSVENSEKDLGIGKIRVRKISEMQKATIIDAIVECHRWRDIEFARKVFYFLHTQECDSPAMLLCSLTLEIEQTLELLILKW